MQMTYNNIIEVNLSQIFFQSCFDHIHSVFTYIQTIAVTTLLHSSFTQLCFGKRKTLIRHVTIHTQLIEVFNMHSI